MPDSQIRIDGRIATDPRYNQANGKDVANLRILAGRSRKNDNGDWETLSTTAYDVAFWAEHAHLVGAIEPHKGDSVIVNGAITGVEKYDGQNGESLSVKVVGDGIRVFPKQNQQQGRGNFGGQQSQQGGFSNQQNNPQQGGFGGNPQQAQQSSGWGQNPSGADEPPF